MNERIRELWRDCVLKHTKDPMNWQTVADEFAELIVRECIKKCQDHPSIIFKNEWDADVVSTDIVSRLESHFGVEE
jgi:hypothetical protein